MVGSLIVGVLVALQMTTGGAGRAGGRVVLDPPVLLTAPLADVTGSLRGPAVELTSANTTLYVSSPLGSCESDMSTAVPDNARDGWKITARVLAVQRQSATVAVQWQRMWTSGRVVSGGAGGTSEIVLGSRDRIPLDQLVTDAAGLPCHGQTRRLELYMWSNVVNAPPGRPAMMPPAPVTLEAWLVHHTPAGVETTYALSMPFDHTSSRFIFRTQPIAADEAAYYLDIDAQVRAVEREDGTLGLWTAIRRALIDASTHTMRVGWGTGGSLTAWAQPGEVVSFDLPPATGGGGAGGRGAAGGVSSALSRVPEFPLPGHRFSLRLRFTPRK